MPEGADTALMQEDVELDGDVVVIPPGVKRGANRRRAGEDVRAARWRCRAHARLRPQDVGVAATLGRATLEVFRRSKSRCCPPATSCASRARRSRPARPTMPIARSVRAAPGSRLPGDRFRILADRAEAVAEALRTASADCDAVITSGGVSRGDEDHVVRTVDRLGQLHFWQIAVKPGRPLAFGRLGRAVFIGLPGNPVAAVICFLRFARPLLVALGGGRWPEPRVPGAGRLCHEKEAGPARISARGWSPARTAGPWRSGSSAKAGHPDLAGRGGRPGRGGRGHHAHRAGRSGRIRAVQRVRLAS